MVRPFIMYPSRGESMNSDQLSKRLHTVASFVPTGSVVADIGSDHAYLPCYLLNKKVASRAVAGEIVEGPFQSAKQQVKEDGLEDRIDVRRGSGLSVIDQYEVDVITIAGMGGPLISQILEDGKEKLAGVKRLILQPNISAISIRNWLIENKWKIIDEIILKEDDKIYEVIVAEPSEEKVYLSFEDRLLGPFLSAQKSEVFKQKWQQEYKQWDRILTQINELGKSADLDSKKNELMKKMTIVKEVL